MGKHHANRQQIDRMNAVRTDRVIAVQPEDERSISSELRRQRVWFTGVVVVSCVVLALVSADRVFAQSGTIAGDAPDAPPPLTAEDLARSINTDETRTVTSRRTTDGVVTEYRDGNRTYLIQVDPKTGLPYYAVDIDGDGTPETWRENAESDVTIGKWKVLGW